MIKLVFIALWACAVTLASTWAVASWKAGKAVEPEQHGGGREQLKTRMISVPVIADGAVQGYVLVQFALTADAKRLKELQTRPDVILHDEAFRTIYSNEAMDFRKLKKQDLAPLLRMLETNINKRLGSQVIEEVFIQELNYIPKADVRSGERL